MIQKIKKILLITLAGVLLLTGCGGQTTTEDTSGEQEHEVVEEVVPTVHDTDTSIQISMQKPLTLHPIYNMDKSVQQNLYLIFDTLVNIEEDGSISANIATNWTYSEEENAMTIRIRDDILWHDGTPLTSEDVADFHYL